jgi:phenylpyruvate tautomerase PptA (4-oxalocrotonate tautomerase family)
MPHVSVKLYPGRSAQQKARLAERIVKLKSPYIGWKHE